MKYLIYGLGKKFQKEQSTIQKLFSKDTIVGYSDMDIEKASMVDSFVVPNDIANIEFDLLLVTQADFVGVKRYLVALGINEQKIASLEKICNKAFQGVYEGFQVSDADLSKRVIIINGNLGFHGGSMVCLFAAKELKKRGYTVDVAGAVVSKDAIEMFNVNGIGILILKSYPCVGGADIEIFRKYDIAICNTFPTIPYVHLISSVIPTVWWLHECPDIYGSKCFSATKEMFAEIDNCDWMKRLEIYAVSSVAKNAFDYYYPNQIHGYLPYGIIDECTHISRPMDRITFTIVGGICELKGQDLFISAAKRLIAEYPEQLTFLIVGAYSIDDFYLKLKKAVDGEPDIIFTGEKNRTEILNIYSRTDVSVCASRIECLQIVTVEGMMHEKLCITTDATGLVDYIDNGGSGLIFESGNAEALYEKMKWAVEHYGDEQYCQICKNGRKVYENNFTMDTFGDRLEEVIEDAKSKFGEKRIFTLRDML